MVFCFFVQFCAVPLFMGWCVWSLLILFLVISQALRFSCWLSGPYCASQMVFYLLYFLVSDPSLGRKWPVQGKKAFKQPNLHDNENRNFQGIREGCADLPTTLKVTVLAQTKSESKGLCTRGYGQGRNCRKGFFNLCSVLLGEFEDFLFLRK